MEYYISTEFSDYFFETYGVKFEYIMGRRNPEIEIIFNNRVY